MSDETPRAMPTNGVGKRTDWLNHKRSLADAWGLTVEMVRLRSPDGRYLHKNCDRLTLVKADAWDGIPSEAEALINRLGNGLHKVAA